MSFGEGVPGILADLHSAAFRQISTALAEDHIGLTVAARSAKRAGIISPAQAKRLERLDISLHFVRHLTSQRAASILETLTKEVQASATPSPPGPVPRSGDPAEEAHMADTFPGASGNHGEHDAAGIDVQPEVICANSSIDLQASGSTVLNTGAVDETSHQEHSAVEATTTGIQPSLDAAPAVPGEASIDQPLLSAPCAAPHRDDDDAQAFSEECKKLADIVARGDREAYKKYRATGNSEVLEYFEHLVQASKQKAPDPLAVS